MAVTQPHIYAEVYQFLVSSPSPEEIIDFRASEETQDRVRHLLDANKMGELSAEERAELDEYQRVNHFVSMLKVYARQKLAE